MQAWNICSALRMPYFDLFAEAIEANKMAFGALDEARHGAIFKAALALIEGVVYNGLIHETLLFVL